MGLVDQSPAYLPASDASLLVRFSDEISVEANRRVIALFRYLHQASPPWLVNLHPAYASLLIDFDPHLATHDEVAAAARQQPDTHFAPIGKRIDVPVRYNGPDLGFVAETHRLTPAQVIDLHAGAEYLVAFLGFAPGFAYLLGLPPQLATPRLDRPRPQVPAGSVGIAGQQTGIYPSASPGGWRLIGETSLDLHADWAMPGDRIRFVPQ
ncbi:MAG: 5-oxoprolinase subunit PxpB [Bryobacteraceae bacterium]|nr:5-oxoprolinase subunit PxpB [Bryobacteraceae bacterium]